MLRVRAVINSGRQSNYLLSVYQIDELSTIVEKMQTVKLDRFMQIA